MEEQGRLFSRRDHPQCVILKITNYAIKLHVHTHSVRARAANSPQRYNLQHPHSICAQASKREMIKVPAAAANLPTIQAHTRARCLHNRSV